MYMTENKKVNKNTITEKKHEDPHNEKQATEQEDTQGHEQE